MPKLIKNIQASVLDYHAGELYYFANVVGSVQFEDFIELNGFVAYLQDFRYVTTLETLDKPLRFGLKNQFNLPTTTLEISY